MDISICNEYDFVVVDQMIKALEQEVKTDRMRMEEGLSSMVGYSSEFMGATRRMNAMFLDFLKGKVNEYKPGTYETSYFGGSSKTASN